MSTESVDKYGDDSNPLRVDPTGTTTQPVSGTVAATQSGTWNVNNVSGTVSLPTGAATAANQATTNTSVASIDTKTPAVGQTTMAGSSPVTIASNQSAVASKFDTPTTNPLTAAVINFSATGENTTIAGTASQTIRVFKLFLVVSTATAITIKDAAGGTALTGAMSLAANGGLALDVSDSPWFITASSGAFIISQSGTAQVSGAVYYTKS